MQTNSSWAGVLLFMFLCLIVIIKIVSSFNWEDNLKIIIFIIMLSVLIKIGKMLDISSPISHQEPEITKKVFESNSCDMCSNCGNNKSGDSRNK